MKAWWKIGDKPRGRWNPKFEFGVHLTPEEKGEANSLNVSLVISYCLLLPAKEAEVPLHFSSFKCREGYHVLCYRAKPYPQKNASPNDCPLYGNVRCNECVIDASYLSPPSAACLLERGKMDTIRLDANDQFCFRLPWRPGRKPDYSDFIEPTRDFLRRVLDEMERRFYEARESAPSDEWMLEEEFDSFSVATWRTEGGVEVAERKLRVIRA